MRDKTRRLDALALEGRGVERQIGDLEQRATRIAPDKDAELGRQCGECSLCCKVLEIKQTDGPLELAFAKVQGKWCVYAAKKAGCKIHHVKPDVCREFRCLWLQGAGPEAMRPDRIGAVLTPTADGEGLIIHEDPGRRGDARYALRPTVREFLAKGHRVFVVCGDVRREAKAPW
jgi:hypothetical protein